MGATPLPLARTAQFVGRLSDVIAIAYFLYIACLALVVGVPPAKALLLWIVPILLLALAAYEVRNSKPWTRVVRDWLPFGLVLLGYWEAGWIGSQSASRLDGHLIEFDRVLFRNGLQGAVESLGGMMPAALEFVYLCLYLIPLLCMGALYLTRTRRRADKFLAPMLLGTFGAYALLPWFPAIAPRFAFPAEAFPNYVSVIRSLNVWLLSHADNATSVFPSGHVAVAFSCAFGLHRALPEKRSYWMAAFGAATAVLLATVYSRYHYAADGIASVGIAALGWMACGVLLKDE